MAANPFAIPVKPNNANKNAPNKAIIIQVNMTYGFN